MTFGRITNKYNANELKPIGALFSVIRLNVVAPLVESLVRQAGNYHSTTKNMYWIWRQDSQQNDTLQNDKVHNGFLENDTSHDEEMTLSRMTYN